MLTLLEIAEILSTTQRFRDKMLSQISFYLHRIIALNKDIEQNSGSRGTC